METQGDRRAAAQQRRGVSAGCSLILAAALALYAAGHGD